MTVLAGNIVMCIFESYYLFTGLLSLPGATMPGPATSGPLLTVRTGISVATCARCLATAGIFWCWRIRPARAFATAASAGCILRHPGRPAMKCGASLMKALSYSPHAGEHRSSASPWKTLSCTGTRANACRPTCPDRKSCSRGGLAIRQRRQQVSTCAACPNFRRQTV